MFPFDDIIMESHMPFLAFMEDLYDLFTIHLRLDFLDSKQEVILKYMGK